jgi:hypothetical protein
MKKKEITISIDGQTPAQETILIGIQNTTSENEEGFLDQEIYLETLDNALPAEQNKRSSQGKKKTSE